MNELVFVHTKRKKLFIKPQSSFEISRNSDPLRGLESFAISYEKFLIQTRYKNTASHTNLTL